MAVQKKLIEKQREAVEAVSREEDGANIEVNNTTTSEEMIEEFDIADMQQVDVKHKNINSSVKGSGCLTVINHGKCGRRLHISNKVWRDLECPKFLKLFIKPNQLFLIADENAGVVVRFDRTMDREKAVQDYNGKIVLYATETVKRITTDWNLEFDGNCCWTGGTYKKCLVSGKNAIVISKDEPIATNTIEKVNSDTEALQREN